MKSVLITSNLAFKLNEIEIDGYFEGKSIKYGWFKYKTTSKLVEFIQKLLHFTKRRGLLHLLPQPFNILTQIYLPF